MSHKPELPVEAAKWNPNDKEREATTHAAIVISFLGSIIQKLSTGCNYEAIEVELRSSIYYYEKLTEILLPNEHTKENTELRRQNDKMKAQAGGWRPLLEKVLHRHEGGLLPDRLLYLEIKKFLYGE